MFGTMFIIAISVALLGCAGIDGSANSTNFLNPSSLNQPTEFSNTMDEDDQDIEEDPGSGAGHPSLGELGTADTEGGTTDEPWDPEVNSLQMNEPGDSDEDEDEGEGEEEDDYDEDEDEDDGDFIDDPVGEESGWNIGIATSVS